jgi:hypothetical protein
MATEGATAREPDQNDHAVGSDVDRGVAALQGVSAGRFVRDVDCRSSRGGRANSPVVRCVASASFDDGAGRPRSGRFRSSSDTRNGFTATVADAVFWQEEARPVDAQRAIHISRRSQNGRNPVDREVGHYGIDEMKRLGTTFEYRPRRRGSINF